MNYLKLILYTFVGYIRAVPMLHRVLYLKLPPQNFCLCGTLIKKREMMIVCSFRYDSCPRSRGHQLIPRPLVVYLLLFCLCTSPSPAPCSNHPPSILPACWSWYAGAVVNRRGAPLLPDPVVMHARNDGPGARCGPGALRGRICHCRSIKSPLQMRTQVSSYATQICLRRLEVGERGRGEGEGTCPFEKTRDKLEPILRKISIVNLRDVWIRKLRKKGHTLHMAWWHLTKGPTVRYNPLWGSVSKWRGRN
jgi:hypothetical protein